MPTQPPQAGDILSRIDHAGFAAEIKALRKSLNNSIGAEDLRHLKKMAWWGRICTVLGYLTAWIFPNPISAFLIAEGSVARWTIVTHHVMHRGYDRVPGVPNRFHSKYFARGWRRFLDWFDWMIPAAWDYEHNVMHHFRTGEVADPDLAEENLAYLRNSKLPKFLRYVIVCFFMVTWKWSYYAPNTWMELLQERARKTGEEAPRKLPDMANPFRRWFWQLAWRSYLPYGLLRFVLLPAAFLPFGTWPAIFVLINSLLAELISNLHSFLIIVPNHTGDDLYRFDEPIRNKDEFFVRQVIGSVNYPTGGDLNDFMHGWLNYQIEHHLFPDLPCLKYQQIQPEVKAICERHGVPYVQENLWKRVKQTVRIMVGDGNMHRIAHVPAGKEPVPDLLQ